MGAKDTIVAITYGGMITTMTIGLFALMCQSAYTCNQVNPWLSYMPSFAGAIGDLLYAMPVLAGLSFLVLVIAFVLHLIEFNKLVVMILGIVGLCLYFGTFLAEACWIGFSDPINAYNKVFKDFYGKSFSDVYSKSSNADTKLSKYYKTISELPVEAGGPLPKQKYTNALSHYPLYPMALGNFFPFGISGGGLFISSTHGVEGIIKGLPVCYYEKMEDRKELKNEKGCIGKWSSSKYKNYLDSIKKQYDNDVKKANDKEQERSKSKEGSKERGDFIYKYDKSTLNEFRDNAIYTYNRINMIGELGAYLFHSFNLGILTLGLIFCIVYIVLSLLGHAKVGQ